MKLKKLLKLNQSGFGHFEILAAVAVIVMVGVVGIYISKNNSSRAATPNDVSLVDNSSNSSVSNYVGILGPQNTPSGTDNAPSSVPFYFTGTQTVTYLAPGQTLAYTTGFKTGDTQCYEVYVEQPKSGTATATVEFANINNYVTKTLSSSDTDDLQQVCVKPGSKTNPGFNVDNLTTSSQDTNIEILQDVISS